MVRATFYDGVGRFLIDVDIYRGLTFGSLTRPPAEAIERRASAIVHALKDRWNTPATSPKDKAQRLLELLRSELNDPEVHMDLTEGT